MRIHPIIGVFAISVIVIGLVTLTNNQKMEMLFGPNEGESSLAVVEEANTPSQTRAGPADDFDKTVPLSQNKLSSYSGEQIFESAYQAYICSYLMTLADQIDKGQFLRYYSVTLIEEEAVRDLGKNWNDVNFLGSYDAMKIAKSYSEEHDVSKAEAATEILTGDSQCITLNGFTERALKAQK
jgi:hypothetical protein